jgi:hypothetical protein
MFFSKIIWSLKSGTSNTRPARGLNSAPQQFIFSRNSIFVLFSMYYFIYLTKIWVFKAFDEAFMPNFVRSHNNRQKSGQQGSSSDLMRPTEPYSSNHAARKLLNYPNAALKLVWVWDPCLKLRKKLCTLLTQGRLRVRKKIVEKKTLS